MKTIPLRDGWRLKWVEDKWRTQQQINGRKWHDCPVYREWGDGIHFAFDDALEAMAGLRRLYQRSRETKPHDLPDWQEYIDSGGWFRTHGAKAVADDE